MAGRNWKTPELVVLLKSQPEENILTQCKAVHGPPTAVIEAVTGQNCKNQKIATCGACQAEGGGLS